MLRKPELYNKAVALRRRGFSYNEILELVPVSQGTISRWCSEIPLTEKQKKRLFNKKRFTPLIRRLMIKSAQSKKDAKNWAAEQMTKITNSRELLFITGIVLYWAEGTKSGGGGIELTNTDQRVIEIMMRFLIEIMLVPENKFKIIVRMGDNGDVKRAIEHWSQVTMIPLESFRKPELLKLKPNSNSLKKYPYGMCRITVNSIYLHRKIMAAIEEFPKKFSKIDAL